jgi:PIN domain nuclease of toxin-antitoxin system
MRLILDTHAFIWALAQSSRLSPRVAALISDRANEILVSAVCAYEIEFKRARSHELAGLPADLGAAVEEMDFDWLPVSHLHATTAGRLPRLHGDPFDRLIVAQALIEQATVITRDALIGPYGAPVFW